MYIDKPTEDYQGLFGYVKAFINLSPYVRYEATVKNLSVSGSVKGKMDVGGVAGYVDGSNIINCSYEGSISGTYYVGGVVGDNVSGKVTNCYNTGSVSGTYYVGGIVGENYGGTVTNCYNTGSVSSGDQVGGLVGRNASSGKVINCYNTGLVSGGTQVGGVVGTNDDTEDAPGIVTNCYYLKDKASGGINSSDVNGSAEVKTEDEFKRGEVAYLLNNSSGDGVWTQTLGTDDYPGFTGFIVGYDETRNPQYYNLSEAYKNTVAKKIEKRMTKDNSEATAVLSEIKTNGHTIHGITWSYPAENDTQYSVSYNKTQISGNTTVYFGIVVPALLTAEEESETNEIATAID